LCDILDSFFRLPFPLLPKLFPMQKKSSTQVGLQLRKIEHLFYKFKIFHSFKFRQTKNPSKVSNSERVVFIKFKGRSQKLKANNQKPNVTL